MGISLGQLFKGIFEVTGVKVDVAGYAAKVRLEVGDIGVGAEVLALLLQPKYL